MAFRVAGWRFGYDVDHACGHILPIKGRLRSFQHLDARNIDQIVDAQPRSRHIDPVDEKTNVRLKCWDISVRSNAADAIALRERPVRLNDGKRRHELSSEDRRAGHGWVSTVRARWSPYQ